MSTMTPTQGESSASAHDSPWTRWCSSSNANTPARGAVGDNVIEGLREEAHERDVYGPQIDEGHGKLGYDFRDVPPLFEQAGRSLLGGSVIRVAASDEGNMQTIELEGTEEQRRGT